jgi:hypothetical protein
MSIFSETVCDKGTTFVRNRSSDNIETNAKTMFNENETRLLRKIVRQFLSHFHKDYLTTNCNLTTKITLTI